MYLKLSCACSQNMIKYLYSGISWQQKVCFYKVHMMHGCITLKGHCFWKMGPIWKRKKKSTYMGLFFPLSPNFLVSAKSPKRVSKLSEKAYTNPGFGDCSQTLVRGGGDAKNIYRKNFSGPPSDCKKISGSPFLPWKLQVNPIEKHVNSIFNGNLW